MKTETCTKCKVTKPLEEMRRDMSRASGYRKQCKACCSAEKKASWDRRREAGLPDYQKIIPVPRVEKFKHGKVFRLVVYLYGEEIQEQTFSDYISAAKFYCDRYDVNTQAVRVWVDGVKLTYLQSDTLFSPWGRRARQKITVKEALPQSEWDYRGVRSGGDW
jgi:hypothetical protein